MAPPEENSRVDSKPPNFFIIDVSLRAFLFITSLIGMIVLVTSNETEVLSVDLIYEVEATAKFNQGPALVYLVVAHTMACFYSLVSTIVSVVSKKYHSNKLLFSFVLFDSLMVGLLASATGSAGAIAYTGLKGNSYSGWGKVCNVYGTFCQHVAGSTILCFISSIVLILLITHSTYTLCRRSS